MGLNFRFERLDHQPNRFRRRDDELEFESDAKTHTSAKPWISTIYENRTKIWSIKWFRHKKCRIVTQNLKKLLINVPERKCNIMCAIWFAGDTERITIPTHKHARIDFFWRINFFLRINFFWRIFWRIEFFWRIFWRIEFFWRIFWRIEFFAEFFGESNFVGEFWSIRANFGQLGSIVELGLILGSIRVHQG